MSTPENDPLFQPLLRFQQMMTQLHAEQKFGLAALAGTGAALVGGAIWAMVTVVAEYQIGWMAVGVGCAVGFAVRLGKGIEKKFGILGAILALVGCLLGNLFSIFGFISKQESLSLLQVVHQVDYAQMPELMMSTFSPMDLLFYAIAVYEGYKFSFRKLNSEESLIASEAQRTPAT